MRRKHAHTIVMSRLLPHIALCETNPNPAEVVEIHDP